VLRPRGGLAIVDNNWYQTEEPPLPAEAHELMEAIFTRSSVPRHAGERDEWHTFFDGPPFEPLRVERTTRTHDLDGEQMATLQLTGSTIVMLPPDEFADVESELRRLIVGRYRLTITTQLYWTRLAR
jgi:hypothetical protein